MPIQDPDLLLRLVLAHFIVDFLTRTEPQIRPLSNPLTDKRFLLHLLLYGLLTYTFAAQWSNWWLPLVLVLFHGILDWVHQRSQKDTTTAFVLDQVLHLAAIVGCWALATSNDITTLLTRVAEVAFRLDYQLYVLGYLLVTAPAGLLIGHITHQWRRDISQSEQDPSVEESLQNAGKWIGMLERTLVFTFILIGEWRAIGFLLAAKSVFRFGDLKEAKDRKRTEYILIGTLLSFTLSIAVGLLINALLP